MPKYDKRISILEKVIRYCEQIHKTKERFGRTYETLHGDFDYQNAYTIKTNIPILKARCEEILTLLKRGSGS